MQNVKINVMLENQTAVGASSASGLSTISKKGFQARVSGTGAVSAVVEIQVTNVKAEVRTENDWLVIGTITLTGTDLATDGFGHETPWGYYRAEVTGIGGTDARVSVYVSEC